MFGRCGSQMAPQIATKRLVIKYSI
jgi:hypothetical protein